MAMPTIPLAKLFPEVSPLEDFLCFEVASRTPGKDAHRVDMQRFCGHGACTCEDFNLSRKRKHHHLKSGAMPAEWLECWHIKQVGRYLRYQLTNALIEAREKATNENKAKAKKGTLDHLGETSAGAGEVQRDESESFIYAPGTHASRSVRNSQAGALGQTDRPEDDPW